MTKVVEAFFLLLASATDRHLVRMVEYLKEENQILRARLPKQIKVTPKERQRLLRLGRPLAKVICQLVGIVTPRTFRRWLVMGMPRKVQQPIRRSGRPRTATAIRELVLRLAQENHWGNTRILGELKKLEVRVSRTTVIKILKEAGLDPGPKRGDGSWMDWLTRHAKTLHACDFFTNRVWTM